MASLFRHLFVLPILLAAAQAGQAQPQTIVTSVKPGALPNLVSVPAPHSLAVTLNESLGLLAFGHDRAHFDGQVSLVKLDAKGQPAAYATTWMLPRPDALKKAGTYALSTLFHPKLPLLYVWQDVGLNYSNPVPPQPPEWAQFDHLQIYSLAKDPPELVVSLCRGQEFTFGMHGGALAVDPAGEYLYVPNLRDVKNPGSFRIGRFRLDPEGLPVLDDKDAKLPTAARVKRLLELNAAKGGGPEQLTPQEYVNTFPHSQFGSAQSFHIVSKETVIAAGPNGLLAWRPEDKQATVHAIPLKGRGHTLFTAHPGLPLLFATVANTDSFYRVEQVEGYLSLLPHQITLPETKLFSAPVVLGKDRLAVGGQYSVNVLSLDANGNVLPIATTVPVLNANVRALVYSPRFDRLYVGVEVSK